MVPTCPTMTIGELAAMFGLAPHVLRHWEDVGLMAPARAGNGRRSGQLGFGAPGLA